MGDFNVDISQESSKVTKLSTITESFQLEQLIEEPTRITKTSETIIDHVYVSCPERISSKVLPVTLSDHCALLAVYSNKHSHASSDGHKFIQYRDMKNFNEATFLNDLGNVPWSVVETFENPNDALDTWYKLYENVLDDHAPIKKKRVKYWHQPKWINKDILDGIHQRDKLFRQKKFDEYKKQRNAVKSMIAKAKKKYYSDEITNNKGNSGKLWQCIRELNGNKTERLPSAVKSQDGTLLHKDKDIASAFNVHFSKVSKKSNADLVNDDNYKLVSGKLQEYCKSKNSANEQFSIPLMTEEFIAKQLKKLDTNKAQGLDNLNPYFLKMSANIITPILTQILNQSLKSGIFPDIWKLGKVTPLHKKGDKEDVNNYRPISVLCSLSKIIERHVHDSLYEFLNRLNLLCEGQSGFRPKHSCATALTHMTDSWLKALDSGKMVGVTFIDFSKAFDSVNHDILIDKLKTYGCSDSAVSWFNSYLSNRSQVVYFKGSLSGKENIGRGVPQGSILGPLLFVLFVNDIPLHLSKCDSDLYADDTSVYTVGSSSVEIQERLQTDMDSMSKWCLCNDLCINVNKTKSMLITTRRKRSQNCIDISDLNILINGEVVPSCESQRLLGVNISNSLDWDQQIKNVRKSINYRLYVLLRIRYFLPLQARIAYCNGYILPYLDYCNTIWGNTTKANLERLHRLQKRAARLIFDDFETLSKILFPKLNWLPISQRVQYNKALLVYKCLHEPMPEYMKSIFSLQSNSQYSLRSETDSNLVVPKPNHELYKNSFAYSGAKLWNSLPVSLRQLNISFSEFKTQIYNFQLNNVSV